MGKKLHHKHVKRIVALFQWAFYFSNYLYNFRHTFYLLTFCIRVVFHHIRYISMGKKPTLKSERRLTMMWIEVWTRSALVSVWVNREGNDYCIIQRDAVQLFGLRQFASDKQKKRKLDHWDAILFVLWQWWCFKC